MAERISKDTKVFDNWKVKEELGRGTYSVVYRLEKSAYGITDTSVLKVIELYDWYGKRSELPEEYSKDMKARIEREVAKAGKEVALMQRLRGSTNIVDYLDFDVYDWEDEADESYGTSLLIRMEKLENLAMEQRNEKQFTDLEIIRLGKDICKALMLCHSQNILHRDIKPDNIYRNENGSYKLGDFGIARILDAAQQSSKKSIGTGAYAAPEQYKGEAYDFRADIYSLGLVMYEMANGNRLPFAEEIRAQEEDVRRRIGGEEIPPLDGVHESLADAILTACCYHPDERYEDAEQFYETLCLEERIVELKNALNEAAEADYAAYCNLFSIRPQSEIIKERQEFETLLQAAERGDAKAQYQVGECYLKGEKSVSRDDAQAMKWISLSAELGNDKAQLVLGEIYRNGLLGVGKNPEEGLRWLLKSAKQGNARAMFDIGSQNERMAETSGADMIEANVYMTEAIAWYKMAAEHGDKLGEIALQRLQI